VLHYDFNLAFYLPEHPALRANFVANLVFLIRTICEDDKWS